MTSAESRDDLGPGGNRGRGLIAGFALAAIVLHLLLRRRPDGRRGRRLPLDQLPLILCLVFGGVPLVLGLLVKLLRREFGSDLLAGISIVTSVLLGEYLAGTLVVLMLSGGEALEAYAVRSASSVLEALARRMPSLAHRKHDGTLADVPLEEVAVGDILVVFPHEICPVDGTVVEGHGAMDESYLTGEPYLMSKAPGSAVLSGAINGETALTIRADKLAVDSRYAKIMQVMRASEQRRPRLRRLGDQLGAFYTPLAVAIALAAWAVSGDPTRFLAVLVVATPCPLLIAIPVAIIGAISLAARRGIIIKDPAVLEKIDTCRTAIFDKTGTLTYGQPQLTEVIPAPGHRGARGPRAGRQPGALLEAPAGRGDPRRAPGRPGVHSLEASRGQRTARRGAARGRWPAGRSGSPAARSWSPGTRAWRQELPPRHGAGWSASSSSTAATPRRSDSATSRGPRGRRSSTTCGPGTISTA